jgi:hypothetical protein
MHRFVKSVPDRLDEGILYISMEYATAIHNCCCGCGVQVVTPFSPTDWKLTFDGETVSLSPSIGNWSLECQSHYWIENNTVHWAPKWTKNQIHRGRKKEHSEKQKYYGAKNRRGLLGFPKRKRDQE